MIVEFPACSGDTGFFATDGGGDDVTVFDSIDFNLDANNDVESVHLKTHGFIARILSGDICDEFVQRYDRYMSDNC